MCFGGRLTPQPLHFSNNHAALVAAGLAASILELIDKSFIGHQEQFILNGDKNQPFPSRLVVVKTPSLPPFLV